MSNFFDEINPHVPAARDWLLANRDAINAIEIEGITPEQRQTLLIPGDIPTGEITATNPQFSIAYARTIYLLQQLGPDAFPAGMQEALSPLDPAAMYIGAYGDIYDTLGTDIQLPDDPARVYANASMLRLKAGIADLAQTGLLGDIPAVDLSTDPFNPEEESFVIAWRSTMDALTEKNLTISALDARAGEFITAALADPNTPESDRQLLESLQHPAERISIFAQTTAVNDEESAQIYAALNVAQLISELPPGAANALQAAIATPSQPDNQTTAPAAESSTSDSSTEETNDEETQQGPPVLADYFTHNMRFATLGIEEVLSQDLEDEVLIRSDRRPDQYLDHDTRHAIEDIVVQNFRRHGSEYYTRTKPVMGQDANNDGEPDNIYTFDEEGNIFVVEKDREGNAVYNDDGTLKIAQVEAVGNIRQGIHVTDEDGFISRPHEATTALVELLYQELSAQVPAMSQDASLADSEREASIIEEQNAKISEFFSDNPENEAEFRAALRRSQGMDVETMLRSDLVRRLREERRGSEEDVDAFIYATFLLERDRVSYSTGMLDFMENNDALFGISNLLRVMSSNDYDPRAAAGLRNTSEAVNDRIISRNASVILRGMDGGETIPVQALYDVDNEEQKTTVTAYFGETLSATREEVYEYVRTQFDIRAIETLSDHKFESTASSPAEFKAQQLAFINQHKEVLDGVSQAMAQGKFNPHEDDVNHVFSAFERPTLDDRVALTEIYNLRENSNAIPPAIYALNNLSRQELVALTGDPDIRKNPDWEAKIQTILDGDIETTRAGLSADGREAYDRLVMNYYEPMLANHTWWRNGEITDDTMNTWNGRYGEPNQDQLMHMFMRYNWFQFDRVFGEDGGLAHDVFYNSSGRDLNYDLTYEEAVSKLTPAAREILDQGIEDLSRPSMYTYLMTLRLDHYRDLRVRHYLPSLIDRDLTGKFTDSADNDNDNVDDNDNDDVNPNQNLANFDPNADPVPQPFDPSDYNLALFPLHGAMLRQMDTTLTPRPIPAEEISTTRRIAADADPLRITDQRTNRTSTGTGTDVVVRRPTEVIPYEPDPRAATTGRGTVPAVAEATAVATTTPTRTMNAAWNALRAYETRIGATDANSVVERNNAQGTLDRLKGNHNLTDADIRAWARANKAEQYAAHSAHMRTNAQQIRAASAATPSTAGAGSNRLIVDGNEARLLAYEGDSVPARTQTGTPAAIEGTATNARNANVAMLGRNAVRAAPFILGGAYAFIDHDEGGWTVAARGGAFATSSAYALTRPPLVKAGETATLGTAAKVGLRSFGRATVIDGVITYTEVGIHVANKDGQAAGSAEVIGAFAAGGSVAGAAVGAGALSWTGIGIPFGAGAGFVIGGILGTVGGVGAVVLTPIEEGAGRKFNNIIYNGGNFVPRWIDWFGFSEVEGMKSKTEEILKRVYGGFEEESYEEDAARLLDLYDKQRRQEELTTEEQTELRDLTARAGYLQLLENPNLSDAQIADYRQALEEIEDHLIDLQNAEPGLVNDLARTWNEIDTNEDGNVSESELTTAPTDARQYFEFVMANRGLQDVLGQARTNLNNALDETRTGRLNALFDGVSNANELQSRLNGDFAHMTKDLKDEWQVTLPFWNSRDSWTRRINDVRKELTIGEGDDAALMTSHLTHYEIRDLRRELYNVREEVEDRTQNLIYQASKGNLSNSEFEELNSLRAELQTMDEIEQTLWEEPGPLLEKAQEEAKRVDFDRARAVFQEASNGSDVDRGRLRQLLNQSANADIVRGREENWFGQGVFQFTLFGSHTNKAGRLAEEYERMSAGEFKEHEDDFLDIEEELEDRIYNLMLDATQGELSNDEAEELGKALRTQERLAEVRSRFLENASSVTGQGDREQGQTNDPSPAPAGR